jgi:hypothetical protein
MTEIQKITRRKKTTTEPMSTVAQRRKTFPWGVIILSLLLLCAIGVAGYFYYQLKWAPQIESAQEIEDLTTTIGEFIELPTNETPTLATVTDREKLADQTFFLKAENGDKVLIYSNSGRAILYRPSSKKVIDMTTVNVAKTDTAAPEEAPTPEAPKTEETPAESASSVTLYNGSTTVGATTGIEQKITEEFESLKVAAKGSAKKKDYEGILVVDIAGKYSTDAQKLATLLGGTVGDLPEGEVQPETDLAVIIGGGQKTQE